MGEVGYNLNQPVQPPQPLQHSTQSYALVQLYDAMCLCKWPAIAIVCRVEIRIITVLYIVAN